MNVRESRQLNAGDRVHLNIDPRDVGTVIENSAESVLINWKDDTLIWTAHADMANVIRPRRGLRDLFKLAPLVALALVFAFLQLKDGEREASRAADPVVAQRAESHPQQATRVSEATNTRDERKVDGGEAVRQ